MPKCSSFRRASISLSIDPFLCVSLPVHVSVVHRIFSLHFPCQCCLARPSGVEFLADCYLDFSWFALVYGTPLC